MLLALSLSLAGSAGCTPNRPVVAPEAEGLPNFGPAEASVFDDAFSPEVFGMSLDGARPERDPKLAVRTQEADSVVRAKVSTVTGDASAASPSYQLTLVPQGDPLSGKAVSEPVEITVPAQSSSFAYVRATDASLVSKTVVLFFRRFNDNGEARTHWHAEADTAEIKKAVDHAKALEEVR